MVGACALRQKFLGTGDAGVGIAIFVWVIVPGVELSRLLELALP